MNDDPVSHGLATVRERLAAAEAAAGRAAGSVQLLAVSKTKPIEAVRAAYALGQLDFGENQLQDALPKLDAMAGTPTRWYFIGPVQGNKTRPVAERFDWVLSVDRERVARRLDAQRPVERGPLNVCLQFNVSGEETKSGVTLEDLEPLCAVVNDLPNLALRGLMAIPAPSSDLQVQRASFAAVREAYESLGTAGYALDTLSMGMTDDLEAAVAEGSTMVRIGTAIFGARARPAGAT